MVANYTFKFVTYEPPGYLLVEWQVLPRNKGFKSTQVIKPELVYILKKNPSPSVDFYISSIWAAHPLSLHNTGTPSRSHIWRTYPKYNLSNF